MKSHERLANNEPLRGAPCDVHQTPLTHFKELSADLFIAAASPLPSPLSTPRTLPSLLLFHFDAACGVRCSANCLTILEPNPAMLSCAEASVGRYSTRRRRRRRLSRSICSRVTPWAALCTRDRACRPDAWPAAPSGIFESHQSTLSADSSAPDTC